MLRFATHHLLPGISNDIEFLPRQLHRKGRRGGIADREPFAVVRDPLSIGDADAGCRAVPGKYHVARPVDRGEIGEVAITGRKRADVFQPKLLDDIADPAFAEAFPGQHVDAAGTEQRPQRHLNRAGVGRRYDADAIIVGQTEQFPRAIHRLDDMGFAVLGTVGSAKLRIGEDGWGPAGTLGTGA